MCSTTRVLMWSGRRDSNSRPLVPETSALPNCATPRLGVTYCNKMYYREFLTICQQLFKNFLTFNHNADEFNVKCFGNVLQAFAFNVGAVQFAFGND